VLLSREARHEGFGANQAQIDKIVASKAKAAAKAGRPEMAQLKWHRTCPGVYVSADGQHKVRRNEAGGWHWLVSNGRGGSTGSH
jgi:hypothetical protein